MFRVGVGFGRWISSNTQLGNVLSSNGHCLSMIVWGNPSLDGHHLASHLFYHSLHSERFLTLLGFITCIFRVRVIIQMFIFLHLFQYLCLIWARPSDICLLHSGRSTAVRSNYVSNCWVQQNIIFLISVVLLNFGVVWSTHCGI